MTLETKTAGQVLSVCFCWAYIHGTSQHKIHAKFFEQFHYE